MYDKMLYSIAIPAQVGDHNLESEMCNLKYSNLYICRGVSTNHTFFYKTNPIFGKYFNDDIKAGKTYEKTQYARRNTRKIFDFS